MTNSMRGAAADVTLTTGSLMRGCAVAWASDAGLCLDTGGGGRAFYPWHMVMKVEYKSEHGKKAR